MYTAAAGMAAQQLRMDQLADDLANVSTTGYKPGRVAFRDLVYTAASRGAQPGVELGSGSVAQLVGRSARQGALEATGEALDVALEGQGFLAVRLPDGSEALTRDGRLRTDAQNRIVTQDGHLTGVTLPAGTDTARVTIGTDGRVTVAGREVGRLRLVDVPSPGGLLGGPGNTFVASQGSGAVRAADPRSVAVRQGSLETSAVDLGSTFATMVEAQRGYQLASKAIATADEMMSVANGVKR